MHTLIEHKTDVNTKTAAGATALMSAAAAGSVDAVRLLLDKGADPNAVTKRNQTALADAATAGSEDIVKLLLNAGAKVDVPDDRGYTALLYAAGSERQSAGIVKMLLAKGANPDLKVMVRQRACLRRSAVTVRSHACSAYPGKIAASVAQPLLRRTADVNALWLRP